MSHGMPDNIDPYKEDLLEKLTNQGYFHDVPNLLEQSSATSVSVNITSSKIKNEG
jgi:hypothetical protein